MKKHKLGFLALCMALTHCKPTAGSPPASPAASALPVEASTSSTGDAAPAAVPPPGPSTPAPAETKMDAKMDTKTETPPKSPDPAPPAPTTTKNAAPTPTHKVAVSCTNEAKFDFTFNGITATLNLGKGPFVNGAQTLVTGSCPKMLTALNGKSFPVATTVSKAEGGPKIQASCNVSTLTIKASEGEPGGSYASTSKSADLENLEVCLQIRNVINALNL